MKRREKIAAIYEEMANTEIELWWDRWSFEVFGNYQLLSIKYWFDVIWHPVMIGTIFEWVSKKEWFVGSDFAMELINIWSWYDKPIDEQSDKCVDFIYSLIEK